MDTRAEAIKEKLLALEGVDEKLLRLANLHELPSILEDGEMPEALLAELRGRAMVATDRRLILTDPAIFPQGSLKTKSFPYEDIRVVRYTTFSRSRLDRIEVVLRDDRGTTTHDLYKPPGIDVFIEYLNTKCLVRDMNRVRAVRKATEKDRSKRKRERQRKGPVKCRKCRGDQLSTQPKGFDWGKAIVGGVLMLPILVEVRTQRIAQQRLQPLDVAR